MTILGSSLPQKPTIIHFSNDSNFYAFFQKINAQFDECFLLESLGENNGLSRYSIIGFAPEQVISASGSALFYNNKQRARQNPYLALQALAPKTCIAKSYAGGLVGFIGYEGINYFESALSLSPHPLFPQFLFGAYTDGLIFDAMSGETTYFYYKNNRSAMLRKILAQALPKRRLRVQDHGAARTKKEHTKMIAQALEQIRAGNSFQCQIGFKHTYRVTGDPLLAYSALRVINPSPYMFYLKFNDICIMGASPELLFRMKNREIETFPLAGTTRRGKTREEDVRLARALINDPKERAEHTMLVDLHRNDIGRIAEFGTVAVRRFMDIKKFSHVQHISSEIAGIARREEDMFTGLASCFPAGTLCGAPKIETIKIIEQIEREPRGPYGGAVGHFGFNGDCTFTIPIRSLFIRGDYGYTQNSSGVVYDSVAEREYEEVKRKGEAMRKVLSAFL